ncbi:MAG: glycoside hydrolase family 92 protein [Bacteroidales bacterium]
MHDRYHAASVIADAYSERIPGFDPQKALDACLASATYAPNDGIGDYMKYGYVPADKSSNAASKTLEYAYDDYCISQMAAKMGKADIAAAYAKRAQAYNYT